jgi:hypothetical protein
MTTRSALIDALARTYAPPQSGRSPETATGRDEPVDDGSGRQRLYPANSGRWAL